jgi:hypothetical protein
VVLAELIYLDLVVLVEQAGLPLALDHILAVVVAVVAQV